jgi:mevalonate kinase
LVQFSDYLRTTISPELLDSEALADALLSNWRLVGDIPTGYGLGSSGAVCAAIWDVYATDKGKALSGDALRHQLAQMEKYFHGTSSGTDPLISYLNAPVLLGGGAPPEPVQLPPNWQEGFFLLDTGKERKASTFVDHFTDRYDNDAEFTAAADTEWKGAANAAIEAILASDRGTLERHMRRVSAFQFRELPSFIPEGLHPHWIHENYVLKICGAGGGGMMLGYTTDRDSVGSIPGHIRWM